MRTVKYTSINKSRLITIPASTPQLLTSIIVSSSIMVLVVVGMDDIEMVEEEEGKVEEEPMLFVELATVSWVPA